MKDFKPLNETAESVEKRILFIQDFLQKKYGFGILFFVLIGFAIYAAVKSYNEGIADGGKSSKEEIISLKETVKNDNSEIYTLKGRVAYHKKMYDSCKNEESNRNIEEDVIKALERSRRLEKILETKTMNTEKKTNEMIQIIPKK